MILVELNQSEVTLQIYAVNPDGSAKLDVTGGTVRVYHMLGGTEVQDLPATPLVNVGTNKWRYDWTPASLPVREYVAEYVLTDASGLTMRLPEDVVSRELVGLAKQSTLLLVQADLEIVRKIETGRWKVANNQMTFYDDDGVTPLLTFNLFDQVGSPTMENVFERVKP
jgi:hypothetical protein